MKLADATCAVRAAVRGGSLRRGVSGAVLGFAEARMQRAGANRDTAPTTAA